MKTNENPMNNPLQVLEANVKAQIGKTQLPLMRMILLGILAGMFIGGGAAASSVAMHAVGNVGIARMMGGAIFPAGLMMIIFIGGELFTGDCLMIVGFLHKKIKFLDMMKVLIVVFLSNLAGSILMAFLVYSSGQFNYTDGLLGAFTIKVAMGKVSMSFFSAFCSGILCNIFVCAAVLMAAASKDIAGKVWAIFFPIFAFVVSGYEHCVANMYYIPAGIMALNNNKFVDTSIEQYGYTSDQLSGLNWGSFFLNSTLPVTLGNIVGGMLFVGAALYFIHNKNMEK